MAPLNHSRSSYGPEGFVCSFCAGFDLVAWQLNEGIKNKGTLRKNSATTSSRKGNVLKAHWFYKAGMNKVTDCS
jgi:hypothetical protein